MKISVKSDNIRRQSKTFVLLSERVAGKKQSVDREGRRRDAAVDTEKAPRKIGNLQKHRKQNDNRQNAACRKTAEIFA